MYWEAVVVKAVQVAPLAMVEDSKAAAARLARLEEGLMARGCPMAELAEVVGVALAVRCQ